MITFGTSGHRGIIGLGFTHEHVTAIAYAVADYLSHHHLQPRVIIGYDPRKGNDPECSPGSTTSVLCDTLIRQGIHVYFCRTYTATPVISWAIPHMKLDGGLILTASHNPPEYNGIKFNPKNGAPAPTSITTALQDTANHILNTASPPPPSPTPGDRHMIDPTPMFCEHIISTVCTLLHLDTFPTLPITIDTKNGTAGYVWDTLSAQCQFHAHIIHNTPCPDFGGIITDPTNPSSLKTLIHEQKNHRTPLAAAHDPDSDRHIILDENGCILTPEECTVIILDYLLSISHPIKGIASTLASSQLIKSACRSNRLQSVETEVGFKYFAPHLSKATEEKHTLLAVESSGGFSSSGHTNEKCGFLPVLLIMAIVSTCKMPLSKLNENIHKKYGYYTFLEEAVSLTPQKKEQITHVIQDSNKETLASFFRQPIRKIDTRDGLKVIFENDSWGLLRLSGTEDLGRLYTESTSKNDSHRIMTELKTLVQ